MVQTEGSELELGESVLPGLDQMPPGLIKWSLGTAEGPGVLLLDGRWVGARFGDSWAVLR